MWQNVISYDCGNATKYKYQGIRFMAFFVTIGLQMKFIDNIPEKNKPPLIISDEAIDWNCR